MSTHGPKRGDGHSVRSQGQDEDLVRLYLDGIGKYPLLSREDEWRLSRLIQEGREAKEQLSKPVFMVPASASWCWPPGRATMPPRAVHKLQPAPRGLPRQEVPSL